MPGVRSAVLEQIIMTLCHLTAEPWTTAQVFFARPLACGNNFCSRQQLGPSVFTEEENSPGGSMFRSRFLRSSALLGVILLAIALFLATGGAALSSRATSSAAPQTLAASTSQIAVHQSVQPLDDQPPPSPTPPPKHHRHHHHPCGTPTPPHGTPMPPRGTPPR